MFKKIILFSFSLVLATIYNLHAQYKVGQTHTGKCSYYAAKFHGRPTASGEKYNQHKFTAAHRKLPFGTILLVTNLNNNKTVEVKVNDRGPFKPERIVDVSGAAAKKIDMIRSGIAKVKIEILSMPGKTPSTKVKKTTPTKKPIEKPTTKKSTKPVTKAKSTTPKNTPAKPKNTTDTKKTPQSKKMKGFEPMKTYSAWGTRRHVGGYGLQMASYFEPKLALKFAKITQAKLVAKGSKETVYIQCGWAKKVLVYRMILGDKNTIIEAKNLKPLTIRLGYKSAFPKRHL